MKNYLIGGLLCLVVALAVGLEPLQRAVNETLRNGTLRGVEECMAYSSSELLSENSIRAACASAFQIRLYGGDYATGRAGPRGPEVITGWGGTLENATSDHVTTRVGIAVSVFDPDGAEQEFFAEAAIWIDPLGEAEFHTDMPDLERLAVTDLSFCDHDNLNPISCITWGVVRVWGIGI